jgi:hypothetical protein
MQQDLADFERRIAGDRSANYRGTALIRLEVLECEEDNDDIKRLETIFKGGCYRLDPKYRFHAAIDQRDLDDAIQLSETSSAALLKNPQGLPPELKFPQNFRLKCFKGRSCAEAAINTLEPEDRWWAVDLFLNGMK